MRQLILGLGFCSFAFLFACTNNQTQIKEVKDTIVNGSDTSSNILNFEDAKLNDIYINYIELKNTLVATNFDSSKSAATQLGAALKGLSGCENAEKIAIQISNASTIAAQRKDFTALNVELIPVFKHANIISGTVFLQHCPMANNGDGGDWLSSEKKIQNPYYGEEMMECGRVVEEIKSK